MKWFLIILGGLAVLFFMSFAEDGDLGDFWVPVAQWFVPLLFLGINSFFIKMSLTTHMGKNKTSSWNVSALAWLGICIAAWVWVALSNIG